MKIKKFQLERLLSVWQNVVDYDFTDTGVHSLYLHELITKEELDELYNSVHLRYIQTNGPIPLRESISQMYPGTDIENILVTQGSSEANFITIWKHIEPADEVVVLNPNYAQVGGMVQNLGATIKTCYLNEERNWAPDLDELRAKITAKTKIIYVTNPNNPTGAILDLKDMKEIVSIAESVGAWILSDEVYRGAELEGDTTPSFWGMYDKALVVSGLSKAFTMPGLRIGWLVGPKEIIADSWTYTDYTTITTGAINAWLAERALRPETQQKIRLRNRQIASKNLKVLTEWIESHPDILRFIPPKINGITFIGYNLNISSTDLVMKLLRDKSVLIAPGEFCGLDGYVRIGYGMKNLVDGLSRISETLKELKATL